MAEENRDAPATKTGFWRQKRVWIPGSLLLLLCIGHTAWWLITASLLDWFVAAVVENERAQGNVVTMEDLSWNGYPLEVRAKARDVNLIRADGVGWQAPALLVRSELLSFDTVRMALSGENRLILPTSGPAPLALTMDGGRGKISWNVDGSVRAASFELGTMVLAADAGSLPAGLGMGTIRVDALNLSGGQPHGFAVEPDQTALHAELSIRGIQLPDSIPSALGHRIEGVGLVVRTEGPLPNPPNPLTLRAWSAAGGTLDVEALTLTWGPLSIHASGPLSLDADLQPSGLLTAEIRGALETIDGMVEAGLVNKQDVSLIRGLVQGMTIRGDGPDAGAVKVPLAVRNQHIWVGPMKLLPIPKVTWGAPVT